MAFTTSYKIIVKYSKVILYITEHLTDNGAERVFVELANEWINNGCKVIIVQTTPTRFSSQYEISKDAIFINLNLEAKGSGLFYRLINYVKKVFSVVKIMHDYKDATVISFINIVIQVVFAASFFSKNRIIFSERNNPYHIPRLKSRRFFRNLAYRFAADKCVFQTKYAMEYFPLSVRKKGVIIPNPINPALPVLLKGPKGKKIISACRLEPQKNIPMMIYAFKMLLDYYPDYKLYIYGRGSLEDELIQLISQEGLDKKVFLPGFTDNIYEELNKSAMFVLSSNFEGISNSMLEALAMGVPTVVTDCPVGGAKMMIENNVNGVLVPVGDVQAMFEAMKKILDDEKFAGILSRNAIKIRNKYPVEKIARMWLEII